jgi:hypothetical protein
MSHALSKIKAAGFIVELDGKDLAISPFSKLTKSQVEFLKSHKAEIIAELQQEQAANDKYNRDPFDDRHFCHECNNLINKRCIVQRFRPLDDVPRRCSDYSQPIANEGAIQ